MSASDELKVLVGRVTNPANTVRWNYYMGEHPKIYATPKLAEVFRALADSFVENYCGLAINSRLSRLEVTGWDGPDAERAQAVWDNSRLPQYQDRLFRWSLVHSRAYLIADEDTLRVNPATIASCEPDEDDPFTTAWGGKVLGEKGAWRASLWTPGQLTRWESLAEKPDAWNEWHVVEEESGPDLVPVTEVVPYGDGPPLIDQIAGLQDRINKIASNKFVAAEFGAFKQRVFFTRQDIDPFEVRQAPDHAIVLDPGDEDAQARVQELGSTDLANYDRAKDAEVDALFTIATLPRHMRVNPGTAPSGEAVKADEGPFVESLRDNQRSMAEALVTSMGLLGITASPIWRDPEVRNEPQTATTVGTLVTAGVPWQTAVQKYAGWDPEEVLEAEAQAAAPTGNAVGSALLSAFAAPTTPTA